MILPIYGLVSSYREGRLTMSAVESLLECCREVFVLEGPVGDVAAWGELVAGGGEPGLASEFPKHSRRVHVRRESGWETDAAKRTALVRWVQEWRPGPAWGVVVDGDETLLWARFLPDYLARSEADEVPGGVKVKLVFEDGQVYETAARCLRLELIDEYVLSGYQLRLKGQATVWVSPIVPAKQAPLQGEPHVFHRGYLRPPERNNPALRLSGLELEALAELGIGQPSPEGVVRVTPGRKIIIPGE